MPCGSTKPRGAMDTFIVRIYRRMARSADDPAGTVEHVETGDRIGFANAGELLDRLLRPRRMKQTAAPAGSSRRKGSRS